jgi:hypothetical protein
LYKLCNMGDKKCKFHLYLQENHHASTLLHRISNGSALVLNKLHTLLHMAYKYFHLSSNHHYILCILKLEGHSKVNILDHMHDT